MKPFSWKSLNYPTILCPPMDGITDLAYRELVAQMGGSAARYIEFVNVKGILYENPKTFFELRFTEAQRPIIAQLFGNDPQDFYEAAKVVVRLGFDAIDVNMGCPAHKVAAKGGGCALMGDTENAVDIVRQTIRGANEEWQRLGGEGEYEVTAKMRLGISDKDTVFKHGQAIVDAGAKCIAIHGRTLKQMYTGEADWEPVKLFKEQVKDQVKVFGSGDVKSLWEAFVRIMTTGADGVMIGRGSFGNPWVFDSQKVELCRAYCIKNGWPNKVSAIEHIPDWQKIKTELENQPRTYDEIKEMAIRHAELMVLDKGEKGIIQMRKHFGWYFTNFEGAKALRSQLVQVNTLQEVKDILNSASL